MNFDEFRKSLDLEIEKTFLRIFKYEKMYIKSLEYVFVGVIADCVYSLLLERTDLPESMKTSLGMNCRMLALKVVLKIIVNQEHEESVDVLFDSSPLIQHLKLLWADSNASQLVDSVKSGQILHEDIQAQPTTNSPLGRKVEIDE